MHKGLLDRPRRIGGAVLLLDVLLVRLEELLPRQLSRRDIADNLSL